MNALIRNARARTWRKFDVIKCRAQTPVDENVFYLRSAPFIFSLFYVVFRKGSDRQTMRETTPRENAREGIGVDLGMDNSAGMDLALQPLAREGSPSGFRRILKGCSRSRWKLESRSVSNLQKENFETYNITWLIVG